MENNKMNSKRKHPFAITCRKCGSNHVKVIAYDFHSLEIRCCECEFSLDCGTYDTLIGDYSD